MGGSKSTTDKFKEHDEKFVKVLKILTDVKVELSEKKSINPLKDSMIRDLRATNRYTKEELEGVFA